MKKLKLDVKNAADFRGLGIVSPEKDYRLCFFLNTALGIDLEKSAKLHVFDPGKKNRKPATGFVHSDADAGSRFYLTKNRQDDFFMIPAVKQADYLFLEPSGQKNRINDFKKLITAIPAVQSCFVIPQDQLIHLDAE